MSPYNIPFSFLLFNELYWLATSGGRFCNILFPCNRHIVLSDSIFWFNKLGVNVEFLLVYVLNRL